MPILENEMIFEVEGEPVAQGRPRFAKQNKGHPFDPPQSRHYKMLVAHTAAKHKPNTLIEGQVILYIDICKGIPKSWSKSKREAALKREVLPISRPDVDNYAKGIKDGLNGIIYKDDSQIVELTVRKYYAEQPKAVIKIIW